MEATLKILNIDRARVSIESLISDLQAAPASPGQVKECVCRAFSLVRGITASHLPLEGDAMPEWYGAYDGSVLTIYHNSSPAIIASTLPGAMNWGYLFAENGDEWHIEFPMTAAGAAGMSPAGEAVPEIHVLLSSEDKVRAELSFYPDGTVSDERDFQGLLDASLRKVADIFSRLTEKAASDMERLPDLAAPGTGRTMSPIRAEDANSPDILAYLEKITTELSFAMPSAGEAASAVPQEPRRRECTSCHAEIEEDAGFCGICGTPVKPAELSEKDRMWHICSTCQTVSKEGEEFCVNCGSPVRAPDIPSPAPVEEKFPRPCPGCQAFLRDGARFCPACGTPATD